MRLAARIVAMMDLTVKDPRRAARALLDEDVPLSARIMGLLLVAVVSAMVASIDLGGPEAPVHPLFAALTATPFRTAAFQWLTLAISVAMIHRIGRSFGGTGSLADAILITVWLQLLMLALQILQLVAQIVAPDVAGMIGLFSLAFFLWLLTNFVAELHGFQSRGAVFVGVLIAAMAMGLVISTVLILVFGPDALVSHV